MGAKQSALSSACFLCWAFFPSSCSLCAYTISKLSDKDDEPAAGGNPDPDEGDNSKLMIGIAICCCCCCILLSIIAGGFYMHHKKGSKKPKFIM
tara:strand:- start:427 stop:708 length:282 start_codon:yes stop_codon:yes gene_type:complete